MRLRQIKCVKLYMESYINRVYMPGVARGKKIIILKLTNFDVFPRYPWVF